MPTTAGLAAMMPTWLYCHTFDDNHPTNINNHSLVYAIQYLPRCLSVGILFIDDDQYLDVTKLMINII